MKPKAQWALAALVGLGLSLTACSDVMGVFAPAEPVPWVLRAPVNEGAVEVAIVATEMGCASGNRADDRISVTLDETDEAVTITTRIKPQPGAQTCPSNPFTPVTVRLGDAIGGRSVIDGSSGEIREFPGVLMSMTLGTPAAAVVPVSPVTRSRSSSGILPTLECEAADLPADSTRASWMSDREVVPNDPDLLLGYVVHRFDLKPTGWHQFTFFEPYGRSSYVWLQYLDGVVVGQVSAQTVLIGHNLLAHTCGGGGWVPDEVLPENVPFDAAEVAPELDLGAIFATTDGLLVSDDRISFADSNDRCTAWIAFEDNLESAGFTVQQTVGYTKTPALDASIETQIIAIVSDGEGGAASVSTTPGGLVTVGPAPTSSLTDDPPRFSGLQPCPLDAPIEVEVLPLD